MDIKKTPIKDLHKIATIDYTHLLTTVKRKAGADVPLAIPRIGAGYYYWTAPGEGWRQANTEGMAVFTAVKQMAEDTKARLMSSIGAKDAEVVMTIPDDSFLFCRDTNGSLELMITGWGYRYPKNRYINVTERNTPKPTRVTVSFKAGGVILPSHPFSTITPNGENACTTDASGNYTINGSGAGSQLCIMDGWTGRRFERTLLEGDQAYEFDITDMHPVTVTATLNGAPLPGEPVVVKTDGREYSAVTDGQGRAVVEMQYVRQQPVSAAVRGEFREKTMEPGGTMFGFEFTEQPKPEPMAPAEPEPADESTQPMGSEPAIIVKDPEGKPVAGWPVRVDIGGAVTDYVSDANGIVALPFMNFGTPFQATDLKDTSNVSMYSLAESQNEYDFMVVPVVEKLNFTVLDNENNPMHGTLALSQDGQPDLILPLDQQGHAEVVATALRRGVITRAIVTMPGRTTSYDPQTGQPVQAPGERFDPIQFTIDAGENDYVLQQQKKSTSAMGLLVLGLIFLVVAILFGCLWIHWGHGPFASLSNSLYNALF